MKALVIYLVALAIVFGGLAFLISEPEPAASTRAFVVVDSSFPMQQAWAEVPAALDEIEAERHEAYALATEKRAIHSWQDELELGEVSAFAPCDFSRLEGYAEGAEADVRILITTSASCPTDALSDWRVVLIGS